MKQKLKPNWKGTGIHKELLWILETQLPCTHINSNISCLQLVTAKNNKLTVIYSTSAYPNGLGPHLPNRSTYLDSIFKIQTGPNETINAGSVKDIPTAFG